ncbi:protein inturned [Phymastichus coffea]|uniref:protein inturned n=1 Tax=Phymastichus coffea TaxID=108790 RepID=UPI00273CF1FF|nr:protein inturned [Phymastichus coffea]
MSVSKDKTAMQDRNYEYSKFDKSSADEERDCWASDSGSSTGSYYSNSTSSAIEWESEINSEGEVFYIESFLESLNTVDHKIINNNPLIPLLPELTRRRSTKAGKLMRLIKRKESYRHSIRVSGLASELKQNQESLNRLYREREAAVINLKKNEKYVANLWIDPERRHKLGRRATVCEAYLGIIPQINPVKLRITVAGFVPDGEALKNKDIKLGDWLQSINSKDVTCQNIDSILSDITSPCNAICQFQRNCSNGNYENLTTAISCPNQSLLARQLVDKEESQILMDSFIKEPLGVICIKISEFSESESAMQGVLYSFPKSKNKHVQSFLITTKGAYITLNHMLLDIVGPQPVSTTVMTSNGLTNIVYFSYKEELLLISIPEKCCNKQEAIELSMDIVCTLAFTNENVSKCFVKEENHMYLDHFFYLLYSRLYKDKITLNRNDFDNDKSKNTDETRQCDFNFILPTVQTIQLPRDAQIQIDAALSEMEAMDYRDWNQDPIECQRLYTILGSCLYHRKYLLGSHLPAEDLLQVHSYLRRHGLINLVNTEQVKSAVIWKKVYPSSCMNRKWPEEHVSTLLDQWFLLVVGCGHNLLAVLLESGGCTAVVEESSGPDIFYVEEAQETLNHIKKIGISTLAEKWIIANAKPEVAIPQKELAISKVQSSITENIVGLIKTSQSKSQSNLTSKVPNDGFNNIISTRSFEEPRFDLNPAYSLEISRNSPSQDSLSQISEVSDQAAPILGRRATREKIGTKALKHSDDSDSDLDIDQISDVNNIRENLLNQAEYIVPKFITTGDKNTLVHYVLIDLFEGILISSKMDQLDSEFLSILNFSSQTIRKLLSDTKRYKKLLSHDTGKINKSLIAIKEHGVLFEWENSTYWVIGRLYSNPRPKELYVCYQECTPQNLVEMAFRLQATSY